jgi:hypothetical protein
MPSTRGRPFTYSCAHPVFATWADELNAALDTTLTDSDPAWLTHRVSEATGRGTYVADGFTVAHGTRLVAYWGHLTLHPPALSTYVLQLPNITHLGSTFHPSVDAGRACSRGNPPTGQAALLNHKCEDPTCSPSWVRQPACTLPIMICTSRRSLRGGSELTYNYDAHQLHGAFTIHADDVATLPTGRLRYAPCCCASPAPCPKQRFIPHLPPAL